MQVTETLGPAWARMREMLFRPFDLGRWFAFGFIFFLQSCVEGGGGSIPNLPGGFGGGDSQPGDTPGDGLTNAFGAFRHAQGFDPAVDPQMIGIIIGVAVLLIVPLIFLALFLGTRGQMMSIHAVATGRPGVSEAWNATPRAGMTLLKFQLLLGLVTVFLVLPFVGIGYAILPSLDAQGVHASFGALMGLGVAATLLVLLPLAVVGSLIRNFVAPLMLKENIGVREGWRRFFPRARGGPIVAFLLLRFVFAIGAALASVLVGLVTCCIGFLPVIHQTLLAPYYVFERAWTLEILASMGSDFDMRTPLHAPAHDPYAAPAPQAPGGSGPAWPPPGPFPGGPYQGGPPGY